MLDKKVTHKRLRPKPSMKNKSKITPMERDYLNYLQSIPSTCCFHCETQQNIQWHHVKKTSSDRKNHARLIPLCRFHHVGNEFSPHGTPKEWRKVYSYEFQMEVAEQHFIKFEESRIC